MGSFRRISAFCVWLFLSFLITACSKPNLSQLPPVEQQFTCDTSNTRAVPEDPVERGPWSVGAKTVSIANGNKAPLTAEVWYPAEPDSEIGNQKEIYDLRQFLPDADAALVPDDGGLVQPCDCYRDLPIDTASGPYPVIVFVHGTASFRTASLKQATHWASRGFIVITADNPKIWLKDMKANLLTAIFATQAQDTVQVLEAVHGVSDDLSEFTDMMDPARIGLAGHSAGARAVSELGAAPGVRVVIPMAGGGKIDDAYAQQVMFIASEKDGVSPYSRSKSGYGQNTLPKRFVGIANTGHLTYTELCSLGSEFGGVIPLVESYGIEVNPLFLTLGTDGCGEAFLDPETGWDIVNYASTLAFEEVLQCNEQRPLQFESLSTIFGSDILELDQQL